MGLQIELWEESIKETLFKSNPHINLCLNRDDFVLNGSVVHIPQSAGPVAVAKNRSTFPATPVVTVETEVLYSLDTFTTDPWFVPNRDLYELSFDKQMEMLAENKGNLDELAGDNLFYLWAKNVPSYGKFNTTGAANALSLNSITESDLIKLQNYLNNQNVPREERYLSITSNQLMDLLNNAALKTYFTNTPVNLAEGSVGKMFGFNIIERTSVVRTNSSKVVKDPTAAAAGGDLTDVALFWQRNMVERAIGSIHAFEDMSNPLYYANLYSLLLTLGGRAVREDNKGVGMLCSVPS